MKRRTFAELFIDKLEELSGGKPTLISNKALREALKWDEQKYKRIRSELWSQGKIIRGRGYGNRKLSTLAVTAVNSLLSHAPTCFRIGSSFRCSIEANDWREKIPTLGLAGSSAAYVSRYLDGQSSLPTAVSLDHVAKVAGRIEGSSIYAATAKDVFGPAACKTGNRNHKF